MEQTHINKQLNDNNDIQHDTRNTLITLDELSKFKHEDFTLNPLLQDNSITESSQSELVPLTSHNGDIDDIDNTNNNININTNNNIDSHNTSHELHLKTKQPLSITTKIAYAVPAFSKMSCLLVLNVNALIFYETKGASLLLISFFTALARCVELFLKPTIAFSSDNSNFKMGRRKPFMLFGCAFYCVFLVCIFSPPLKYMSPIATSLWFGVFYVLFFVADTICTIPYHALGPELSVDSKQREHLYLFVFAFQYVGVLLTSIGPVIIQKIVNNCDCSYCYTQYDVDNEITQCINACNSECGVNSNEKSLLYMCMLIGFIFVTSIIVLSGLVKENKTSFNSQEQSYIVPTLYRMMTNKPFIRLLLPYILDICITQIFATMLPFFITYIINPYGYCKSNGINLSSFQCSANSWLGITMFSFFICSLITVIGWHFYANAIGKKKAWQSYSAICLFTFSLFLFCGFGNTYLMAVLCAVNSIPASGAYLNDVFLTDTIDYDEFLTGKRNEGVYMVFSVFIPKLVGIAAQSIPLTIMSLLGFVPSKHGVVYEQPKGVIEFIRFYLIGFPVLLSIISFYLKSKYPIDEKKMNALTKAIAFQNIKITQIKERVHFFKIKNPIYSNEQIIILPKTQVEKQTQVVIEHFLSEDYLIKFVNKDYNGIYKVKFIILCIWFGVFVLFTVVLGVTFKYLEKTSLNLFPLFSLIIVTLAVCFVILNIIQLRIIAKVRKGEIELDTMLVKLFLYKIQREKITEINVNGTANGKDGDGGLETDCVNLINECKKSN